MVRKGSRNQGFSPTLGVCRPRPDAHDCVFALACIPGGQSAATWLECALIVVTRTA
jgi:hypothetical protein